MFNPKKIYNDNFFSNQKDGSFLSARKIVPIIMEMIGPKSVVDVGCGIGSWLKAFEEAGLTDYLGIDGGCASKEELMIDKDKFIGHDLTQPFIFNRRFDLAISLEVAEHIDKKYAGMFIENLTKLADVIVFSAAVPKQGGTHHVNERWPSYWKKIFNDLDYELLDPFRRKILDLDGVEWWYKQNILLAVKKDLLVDHKYLNLPKFREDFITLYYPVFRRNVLTLRMRHIIDKYILKRTN